MKKPLVKTVSLLMCTALLLLATASPAFAAPTINGHTVVTDSDGKIVSWLPNQDLAYDAVTALAWNYLLDKVPDDPKTGKPAYMSQSYLNPDTQEMSGWPNNPAGMYAMLIESAIEYYKYSGNSRVLSLAQTIANQQLSDGMTLPSDDWSNVPYASGDAGSLVYRGASFGNSTGVGDGAGYLEPDKVAELGYALLKLYECTGNAAYRDAAVAAADALAAHVRTGSSSQSPWPFRVNGRTGEIREQYSAHVISAIELFDELDRLNLADTAKYRTARATAWAWMMAYPMKNNAWSGYFEDVPIQSNTSNTNQLNAMMVARYLLRHPDKDPDWLAHVHGIISWVESTFGVSEYGAMTIREQQAFMHAMGSHTSRYASVNALLYARTGDVAAKEKAYRAFNWATYMARSDGVVIDGPTVNNQWFTDGYGDYIRHFLVGMYAVPEWAPTGQTHLLESSSVITKVVYGTGQVTYTTFDSAATETIKTIAAPASITVGGRPLDRRADLIAEGWTFDPDQGLLRIRHDSGGTITVAMTGTSSNSLPIVSLTAPGGGSYPAPASIALSATASDADGTVTRVEFHQDGRLLGQDAAAPYRFDVAGLAAGTYTYLAKAYDNQGGVATSSPLTVTVTAPGSAPLAGVDVGSVGIAGSTTVSGGTITVKGSGVDIWGTADSFHFAHQAMAGDGSMTVRVTTQQSTHEWAKAGVMIRDSLGADSRHVFVAVTSDRGIAFHSRTTTGGETSYRNGGSDAPPSWLRLTRTGSRVNAYSAADGETWSRIGSADVAMGTTAYVGLAVSSHDNDRLDTAVFDNVRITGTTATDATPPLISDVTTRDVNQNGATVSWVTSEPSTSQIEYGPTAAYGSVTALNTNLDTSHTQVVAGLAEGTTYHFRVNSTDVAGNRAVSPDLTFATPRFADDEPPTAPTNLAAVIGADGAAHLSWAPSTDNVGVVGYNVHRNNQPLGSSTTTSYVDSTAPSGTNIKYSVLAVDAAGNVSAPSGTVSVTTHTDSESPTMPPTASSLAVDTQVATHASAVSTSIVSPKLTTSGNDELLVAFLASDGPASSDSTFATVTGGGLTWTLRKRVNGQSGTSEIWTAPAHAKLTDITITATRATGSYHSSIVVTAFSGADLSTAGATGGDSAEDGAPSASLTTTRAGSWIWAVGNDWDRAVERTIGAGQVSVDQFLTPAHDTFWVQRRLAPTPTRGTEVTIAVTAPTSDQWNLALLEILPAD